MAMIASASSRISTRDTFLFLEYASFSPSSSRSRAGEEEEEEETLCG